MTKTDAHRNYVRSHFDPQNGLHRKEQKKRGLQSKINLPRQSLIYLKNKITWTTYLQHALRAHDPLRQLELHVVHPLRVAAQLEAALAAGQHGKHLPVGKAMMNVSCGQRT